MTDEPRVPAAPEKKPGAPAAAPARDGSSVLRAFLVMLGVGFALFAFGLDYFTASGAGGPCAHADDCHSGVCITLMGSGTCATPCEDDDACSEGDVCRRVGGERVCWAPATVHAGEPCVSSEECLEGACVSQLGGELGGRCAVRCRHDACDDGFVCIDERCLPRDFVGLPAPRGTGHGR